MGGVKLPDREKYLSHVVIEPAGDGCDGSDEPAAKVGRSISALAST